ncbi:MAG: hypothetical protein K0S41_3144 [Anaerocolumna sp.]|jgi:hypothetical protein|nr:hypothetical protein [Anaerocolumna sp.]
MTIKKITAETINEFAEKIEYAKLNFIPMLPFVKMSFHDFDRYKHYSDKGIYLIDYIDNDYCLYHLYHLSEGDDTLRATLILPSSWEKRFDIIEKSIPNLKEWFLKEDKSNFFIIQSLEYGEIEYYPTLSHYLIPTIIQNGFNPKYRMYMKRDKHLPLVINEALPNGLQVINYTTELLTEVTNFYYHNKANENYRYFTNCTYNEFLEMFQDEFTINNSKFITNDTGTIIAGIVISKDSDKVWIDNFTVTPEYDKNGLADYLLNVTLLDLTKMYPEETIYIYLNRDCNHSVLACEKNDFVPFEHWTDMILERKKLCMNN